MAAGFLTRGTAWFALTELRVQLHEGLAIASSMLVQVVLIVFVVVLARPLLPYALIGAVAYSVFQVGQRLQNEAAYVRIDHRLHELYHASPLRPDGYFLGMALGIFLAYLPPVVALVILAEVLAPFTAGAALVLLGVLAALWLLTSSFGYIVSTMFVDNRAIWPYASLITNGFGVLPPVFYPLQFLPPYWHSIALVIPTSAATSLVEAAQGGLVSLSASDLVLASVALAGESLALFVGALYWSRRFARES